MLNLSGDETELEDRKYVVLSKPDKLAVIKWL